MELIRVPSFRTQLVNDAWHMRSVRGATALLRLYEKTCNSAGWVAREDDLNFREPVDFARRHFTHR
jgi:hypothetical protein